MKKLLLVVLASLVICASASAGIDLTLEGTPTLSSGNYIWDYSASLATLDAISSSTSGTCDTPSAPIAGTAGTCGAFFTIYDFQGFVGISGSLPSGWSWSEQVTGLTPSGVAIANDGTGFNLTFYYTGAQIKGTGASIGDFNIISEYVSETPGVFSYQVDQGTEPGGPTGPIGNLTTLQGSGAADVPLASQPGVPEPGSILLLGSVLVLAIAVRRKFARQA